MNMDVSKLREERRRFRRVFTAVPEEDMVLFSGNNRGHSAGRLLDFSPGGALVYTADPGVAAEVGSGYKLYFQSRGQMFHLEGTLVRREMQFFAFQFVNVTPLDVAEIRSKVARMEILAARMCAEK